MCPEVDMPGRRGCTGRSSSWAATSAPGLGAGLPPSCLPGFPVPPRIREFLVPALRKWSRPFPTAPASQAPPCWTPAEERQLWSAPSPPVPTAESGSWQGRRRRPSGRRVGRHDRRWAGGLNSSAGREPGAPPSWWAAPPGVPIPGKSSRRRRPAATRRRRRGESPAAGRRAGSALMPYGAGPVGGSPSPGSGPARPGRP